ncbi:hypothetical protein CB1_001665004 [Camelus ferus]|nr:hypothetical protein CB1_001665004 [Camelus ferus]
MSSVCTPALFLPPSLANKRSAVTKGSTLAPYSKEKKHTFKVTLSVTMGMNSSVNDFILYELARDALREKVVFVILLVYLTTLLASFLIVMTLRHSQTLGNPTYFLLFCFSFADSCLSTTTAPRLIVDSIPEKKFISYNECMTQIFASHVFGCMEILVLTLMSFDHYVVILSP